MEIAVLNRAGEETGRKVDLNPSIYSVEPNDHAIYLDVKQYCLLYTSDAADE